jgi:hypothetical protein
MAVIKCKFTNGKLKILEVLKVQKGDSLIMHAGDCVMPRFVKPRPPSEVGPEQVLPCPGRVPPKRD